MSINPREWLDQQSESFDPIRYRQEADRALRAVEAKCRPDDTQERRNALFGVTDGPFDFNDWLGRQIAANQVSQEWSETIAGVGSV